MEKEIKNTEVKENATPTKKKVFGKVVNGKLNLRQRPTLESNVIKVLENGTTVQVLSSKNGQFLKVLVGDVEGYCMKNFIEVKNYESGK